MGPCRGPPKSAICGEGFSWLGKCLMRGRAFLMAIALGVLAVAPAQAADQSLPPAKAPAYYPNSYFPPATQWTGFYAGVHVGGAFGNGSWVDPYVGVNSNPNGTGIEGGGQIGVNYQWDWFVLGFEADIGGT